VTGSPVVDLAARRRARVECADCGRPTGMVAAARALPYTVGPDGRRHCANRGACKRHQAGRSGSSLTPIDPTTTQET
jgi:hypothetical protein